MIAWIRYRVCRALALPRPAFYNLARYPRTLRGGWRYLREQAAPAEVAWYENEPARRPFLWWVFAGALVVIGGVATGRLWLGIVGVTILTAAATAWIHYRRTATSPVDDDDVALDEPKRSGR